jgi:pimeloyl-ACP methyl ester carboxylesterase
MPTDLDIINLVIAGYQPVPAGFSAVLQPNGQWGDFLLVKVFPDCVAVGVRGSVDPQDYLRDAASEYGRPVTGYPRIGMLPFGFSSDILSAYGVLPAIVGKKPVLFWGHSRGAAVAFELAGLHVNNGGAIARIVAFGSPRPGTRALTALLAFAKVNSYRNLSDPVCDVPVTVPLALPWEHPRAFIHLAVQPVKDDLTHIAEHSQYLYQRGVAALQGVSNA